MPTGIFFLTFLCLNYIIESRSDWSTGPPDAMPVSYRVWEVWNTDVVLFSIPTGVQQVTNMSHNHHHEKIIIPLWCLMQLQHVNLFVFKNMHLELFFLIYWIICGHLKVISINTHGLFAGWHTFYGLVFSCHDLNRQATLDDHIFWFPIFF